MNERNDFIARMGTSGIAPTWETIWDLNVALAALRADLATVERERDRLRKAAEEDFGGPAAEDWPAFTASEEQKADLTRAIEAAFVAWLERHNMVPDWRVAENPERLTLGAAREMVTKSAS